MSDLKPYQDNPRHNNKSAKIVAKSIETYGYINPIVVTEDNIILAGHTCLKALKILGIEDADVLVVKGLNENQIKGFVIADNRVGEYSQWNYSAIDRLVTGDNDPLLHELGITSFKDNKAELENLIKLYRYGNIRNIEKKTTKSLSTITYKIPTHTNWYMV